MGFEPGLPGPSGGGREGGTLRFPLRKAERGGPRPGASPVRRHLRGGVSLPRGDAGAEPGGEDHHADREQRAGERPEGDAHGGLRLLCQAPHPGRAEGDDQPRLPPLEHRRAEHTALGGGGGGCRRPVGHGGEVPRDAGGLHHHPQGGRLQRPDPHHRGERHRQGTRRRRHPRGEPPGQGALHRHQLRRHPREPPGERTLRAREGGLHRGPRRGSRQAAVRPQGDPLPRRDR